MSFASNINRICAERGTNLTALVKEVKGSASFTTAINRGSLPKESELIEMARILNCTVADFFIEPTQLVSPSEPETRTIVTSTIINLSVDEKDLIRIYQKLPRRQQHKLLAFAYDMEETAELEGDKSKVAN